MKVICKNGGRFEPRDGSAAFVLKPGDEVPAYLAETALQQGWGVKAKPATRKPAPAATAAEQKAD
jgi:hypothetical protein